MDLMSLVEWMVSNSLIKEVSNKSGLDNNTVSKLINSALPMMLWGLSSNADKNSWMIDKVLDNHNDSILWDLTSVISNPESFKWDKILNHILWDNEERIEKSIGAKLWLNAWLVAWVMKALAPLVMGQLWSAKREWINVASLLESDTWAKWMLLSFLDRDWDWEITDDLLKMGWDLLKKKFM